MFKRSRRNIVAAIMSILVLLWVSTLGVIYATSYFDMKKQDKQMLQMHAQMYTLSQSVGGMTPPSKPSPSGNPGFKHDFTDSPKFRLSTFYTVAVSYSGEVLEIKNEPPSIYTNGYLQEMAEDIIEDGVNAGTEDNLSFLKVDKNGYVLVAFMDNTVVNESAMTLFRHTLLFGGVAVILFFFVSVFLAKKIVKPLEESYQKQKQFISDAGHELKTPISVVSANAELLSRELGDNQWLANIQYENERMGMLVGQLLELARMDNVPLQMEYIDLSRLVSGEALPFESVAFERDLLLNCDMTEGISVEGNSTQLKQLISILLDNAIRHSKPNGEVRLCLRQDGGTAQLSVINQGNAIPVQQREQIFERFYRIDPARNGEDKHYGLGLAIAKAIVNAHRGSIAVLCYDSLVEFRVNLPTARQK